MISSTRTTGREERSGSAERWGPLCGSRARDLAANEEQQVPTYEAAIRRVGVEPGDRVLDIGCGSGVFLRLAADRGAEVSGVDASSALLELAAEQVPGADLRTGEMEDLPFPDDGFDLVAGFNSFFFAEDMTTALREAGRVTRPGAAVLIQVWGNPDRCAIEAMKAVVRPYMPGPPPGRPQTFELWQEGVLEEIAIEAGLRPQEAFGVEWAYEYPDEPALVRAMLAPGGVAELVADRIDEVAAEIVAALAPYRLADGSYRLPNEFRLLLTTA
jgi:SAM-dependent methyltransferase